MRIGVRDMAHWLRAIGTLAKDQSSVPSTDMATHNHL